MEIVSVFKDLGIKFGLDKCAVLSLKEEIRSFCE